VRAVERGDGKFVVRSNDDTLHAEDLALGYKQLMRVGEAWRTLKLAQLSSPNGEIWQVTEARQDARKRLKSPKIKNPPKVLHLT
jgi:hypothetical protein